MGPELLQRRQALGLTRAQLAGLAHTTGTTIYRIETGRTPSPGLRIVRAIEQALEVAEKGSGGQAARRNRRAA